MSLSRRVKLWKAGFSTLPERPFASPSMSARIPLLGITRACMPFDDRRGSILTLSYYGAEKVVPHYNVMGVAKAALEATVRYLAPI